MSVHILVPNYARIVTNKDTNSYRLEFYNSNTGNWETVLEIDPANKVVKVFPALTDNAKLEFGSDRDFSLYYDSTTDEIIVRDEVNGIDVLKIAKTGIITAFPTIADNTKLFLGSDKDFSLRYDSANDNVKVRDEVYGTEIVIPRNVSRNLGLPNKHRYASATGVSNGASGSPAVIVSLSVTDSAFMTLLPLLIKATPNNLDTGAGESITYRVEAVLDTGSVVTLYTASGVTSSITITFKDLDFTAVSDGRRITEIRLTAESNLSSPASTSDGEISAIEYN